MSRGTWDGWGSAGGESGEWSALEEAQEPPEHRYVSGQVLGRGGMGEVTLAWDPVLRREVAIKRLHHTDPARRRRLEREARITAVLDHPNIVPVFDAGVDASGEPWYAMRVVRGQTLRAAIRAADTVQARLGLVRSLLAACHAVAHAHRLGIVHRDLKPENMLLGLHGEVQVMDWGLARPLLAAGPAWDAVLTDAAATAAGVIVGSPHYMSPEAASGEPPSESMDVWSLGVCLFEILTGAPPFSGDTPRAVLTQVLARTIPEVRALVPEAPAELAAVVARACAVAPADRYPSAEALADDLEAWLDGRRVQALAYTPADTLRWAVRRNRLAAWTVALAVLALLVGGGAALHRSTQQRAAAEAASDAARANLARALSANAQLAADRGDRASAETLAAAALRAGESPRARGLLMDQRPRPQQLLSVPLADCPLAQLSADGALVACQGSESLRAVDTITGAQRWTRPVRTHDLPLGAHHLLSTNRDGLLTGAIALETGEGVALPVVQFGDIGTAWSPDTIIGTWGPESRRLDLHTRTISAPVFADTRRPIGTARSGEGFVLGRAGVVIRLSGGGASPVPTPADIAPRLLQILSSTLSEEGDVALLGTLDGEVLRVSLADGAVTTWPLFEGAVRSVSLSADRRRYAALDNAGGAWWWSDDSAPERLPGSWQQLRWSGSTELMLLGDRLERWQVPDAEGLHGLRTDGGISAMDWGAGLLAAATGDGWVEGWDHSGQLTRRARVGRDNVAKDVGIDPQTGALLGAGIESETLRWIHGIDETAPFLSPMGVRRVTLLHGLWLLAGLRQGPTAYTRDGELLDGLMRAGEVVRDIEPDPARRDAVVLMSNGSVYQVDGDRAQITRVAQRDAAVAAALGPDGAVIVASKAALERLGGWQQPLSSTALDLATSGDGRWIASAHLDGEVRVWRADSGALQAVVRGHRSRASAVVFSPDSTQLASGGWDGQIRVWDLASLEAAPDTLQAQTHAAWGLDPGALLEAD